MNKVICFVFIALLSQTTMAGSDHQWITCTYQHQYKYREIDHSNFFGINYYMRNFTRTNSSRPWVEMIQAENDDYVGVGGGAAPGLKFRKMVYLHVHRDNVCLMKQK